MSKNIKEIGKELLGKSLNSFHRKTGLTQLERSNEIQDGILDGILSQVDDAYIEKTEQSNVIHLDGSGDGVVVLDSIEGNTMVNLFDDSNVTTNMFTIQGCKFNLKTMISRYGKIYIPLEKLHLFKSNGKYKVIVNITKNTLTESEGTQRQRAFEMLTYNYANNAIEHSTNGNYSTMYDYGEIGIKECIITMKNFDNPSNPFNQPIEFSSSFYADSGELEGYIIISEYNENIIYPTQPFKGLQSSFEEKVNDEGKYEIEILSRNEDETKSNKIKVLVNEPLRSVGDIKDRLCIKDDKLVVERSCGKLIIDGTEPWTKYIQKLEGVWEYYISNIPHFYSKVKENSLTITDRVITYQDKITPLNQRSFPCVISGALQWRLFIQSTLTSVEELKQWLRTNPITVIYELAEPFYEEVTNEYGEPIILEGYENGTLYIDSTVIPTTTVRYTPKMESFKTLKEVNKNNNLITLDINENIIPYMMDVDYMIMEKELCLLNTKNIRKMEVLDMTSMQKRTQEMLERLIKGKTLTEQECKTRVTTYLNAGKITDEQAEELMLVISEIYN